MAYTSDPSPAKSAALPERSGFQPSEAQAPSSQAPASSSKAQHWRLGKWAQYGGIFSAAVAGLTLINSADSFHPGTVVNSAISFGTAWLFLTRFRRLGFRVWLPVVAAFLGFNCYSFLMYGVLHWGAGAYHLLMFFGSVTALLMFVVVTLLLPRPQAPVLPSRSELALELAKEEMARLVAQDKTDHPEFMAWQSVVERYQTLLTLKVDGGQGT